MGPKFLCALRSSFSGVPFLMGPNLSMGEGGLGKARLKPDISICLITPPSKKDGVIQAISAWAKLAFRD